MFKRTDRSGPGQDSRGPGLHAATLQGTATANSPIPRWKRAGGPVGAASGSWCGSMNRKPGAAAPSRDTTWRHAVIAVVEGSAMRRASA